jgi:hypothetical protein
LVTNLQWGAAVVFLIAVAAEVAVSWKVASAGALAPGHHSFVVLLVVWTALFAVGVMAALRLPRRSAVGAMLVAGIAIRLAALAGPPTTSDDLFRYSWDGRVQAAGVDSYAEAPAAPQLAGLRETWLWPDAAQCAALNRPAGCSRINRIEARTIYPPVAEAWFAAVYQVVGIGARYQAWQVAGLLTEAATLALLAVALGRFGRDRRWLALYALCPAPVIELVNNGHVDGLAIALVVAAVAVAAPLPSDPSWEPWRDVAVAALLTGAALVKLYPAVLLLPLVACRPHRRLPALWRVSATGAVLTGVVYAPHVARVGAAVLGYLPGYLAEEHYNTGGRFLIASVLQVPGQWAGALSLAGIGVTAAWIVAKRPPLASACAAIVAALLLATSPAQPWYAVTLVALATVAARPAYLAVVAAGYAAAITSTLDRSGSAMIGGLAYSGALVVLLGCIWRHRRGVIAPDRGGGTIHRPGRRPTGTVGKPFRPQPQRDSNPCRHLESAGIGVRRVLNRRSASSGRPHHPGRLSQSADSLLTVPALDGPTDRSEINACGLDLGRQTRGAYPTSDMASVARANLQENRLPGT